MKGFKLAEIETQSSNRGNGNLLCTGHIGVS